MLLTVVVVAVIRVVGKLKPKGNARIPVFLAFAFVLDAA